MHLLVVMTSGAVLWRLQHADRPRCARKIDELFRAGKTVKILAVGKKGRDQLRRLHGDKIVKYVDLFGPYPKHRSGRGASRQARRCSSSSMPGEFDVATLFFSRFAR